VHPEHPDIPIIGEAKAPPVRVAISIPTHAHVPFVFAYDLARLLGWSAGQVPHEQLAITLNASEGTYIHRMRQTLVEAAIKTDATHILFLDTDMRFPQETLLHLLTWRQPIVGINYATRRVPAQFVAVKERVGEKREPVRLVTKADSTGLEEVESMGFGVTLIQLGVFAELGSPPWFQNVWDEDIKRWVGEDTWFCLRAREAGLSILVDHDLSKECAHVGQFEFGTEHAEFCGVTEASNGDQHLRESSDNDQELAE